MPNQGRRTRLSPKALKTKAISLAVASCFAASASTVALANPTVPSVVSGSAIFSRQGNLLAVTNSPGAIINWQGFSIAASEITRFIQQSAASSVLNRVTGVDPSILLGALQSNGRVFLINPNGVLFGQNSRVDVAGLVASTLNISDRDFLAGKFTFTDTPGAGRVVNQGAITTPGGGQVYLIAPNVQNSGIITSPQGEIILAAGRSVELVDAATPNLRVGISAPDAEAVNVGQIIAKSGKVGIYGGLIRNRGEIRADGVVAGSNGEILLKATRNITLDAGSQITANGVQGGNIAIQSADTTLVSGTVEAMGSEGPGGTVHVLGNMVGLGDTASINVSGATGGGTVLVGGDYQGQTPQVQNAFRAYVGPQATITADAVTNGDGGKVVVWSDDATRFYGAISAKGGAQSGNGGLVETSGKLWLDFQGRVDTSAPFGSFGTLLLDPTDITISAIPPTSNGTCPPGGPCFVITGAPATANLFVVDLITALGSTNVIVNTSSAGAGSGDINVNTSVPYASGNSLTLQADRNINVIGNSIVNSGAGAINLTASNDINVVNATVFTGGPMNVTATNNLLVSAGTAATALQSTGLQTINANGITVQGATAGVDLVAAIASSGGQTITAGNAGITLNGGTGGTRNFAVIAQQGLTNDQLITVNGGGIVSATGGGGSSTLARIDNAGNAQSLTFTAGGALELTGGAGLGGSNEGGVRNNGAGATTQTIAFTGGGAISITGGTNGINNIAGIFAAGNQTISGNPDITLIGGASGNSNRAQIALETGSGVQTINGRDINLTGGAGGTLNAATINTNVTGMTSIITATGSVSLTGSAGTDSSAAIGSNSGDYNLTLNSAGPLSLTGGSGGFAAFGAVATIGATSGFDANVTINSNAAVTLTSGTGPGASAAIGSDTGGGIINVSAGVGGSSNLTLTGIAANPASILTTGNITLSATNDITVQEGRVSSGGPMNVTATNNLNVTAGPTLALLLSGGLQTISADAIMLQGGSAIFADAILHSAGGQIINAADITLIGGNAVAGEARALIRQFGPGGTQTINLSAGGTVSLQGGSGGPSNYARILSEGVSQSINFAGAGALTLTGGTGTRQDVALVDAVTGSQTITGSPTITLIGGAAGGVADDGNSAQIRNDVGPQTITAGAINMVAGPGGVDNRAEILSFGPNTQTINASGILTIQGGTNTLAEIKSAGGQVINAANITLMAGSGDNGFAQIRQTGAGADQVITLTSSVLSLQGGSGGVDNFARIRNEGASQQIIFANAGGVLTLSGGTGASGNFARAQALTGTQSITGSPTITLTGGASGGVDDDGNFVQIIANAGSQSITAGNTTLLAGIGGVDNSASILAPNQNMTVNGSLVLTGGADSSGLIVGGGGARIGGLGGASPTPTDLVLTVTGNVTLTGGAGTGVAIGSSPAGGQPTDITMNVTGDLTLTPGPGPAGARIGSPSSSVAGGDIFVTANHITLDPAGPGGARTAVRTDGDITLHARSGNLTIGGSVNAGGYALLRATAGAIIDNNGAENNVTARHLEAAAAHGINLDIAISGDFPSYVNATNSTSGDISLRDSLGTATVQNIHNAGGTNILSGLISDADSTILTGGIVIHGEWPGPTGSGGDTEASPLNPQHTFSTEGGDVTLILNSPRANTFRSDPVVYLLDSAGTVIERDDDAGQGFVSRIDRPGLPAGTYRVVAATFSDGQISPFDLSIGGAMSTSLPLPTEAIRQAVSTNLLAAIDRSTEFSTDNQTHKPGEDPKKKGESEKELPICQ